MANKYVIGILVLVLLTASIYILVPDNVRIDVRNTYSTFKVWENDSWILAGQEYTLMFDGTTKMRASSRTVESFVEGNIVKIVRTANFKDNVTVIDTYTFDGNEKDIKLFPISHDINVLNGEGYILVYEVTKLEYFGETIKDILSPQEFGHNMRIEWEGGNYYSRIWGYANRDEGKLTVKYRPDSADFTKQVRLFDPPIEEPDITYTSSTDKICINGTCNLILYSGVRNVYEDGVWKRVEDARSLKDKEGIYFVYLENDSGFDIITNEFNISYVNMTLQFLGNPLDYPECQVTDSLNAKCDFKIDEKWEEINDTTGEIIPKSQLKFQYKWEMKQGVVIKGDKVKYEYNGNPFARAISFGGNSTTIKLQDNVTEVLENILIESDNPDFNAVSQTITKLLGSTSINDETLIKFNISSIPSDVTIENSVLFLYMNTEGIDTGEGYYGDAHHLYNQSWGEASMTWNIALTMDYNSTREDRWIIEGADPTPDAPAWVDWTVTSMLEKSYLDNDANFSIWIRTVYWKGNPGAFDYVQFHSKRYAPPITLHPYLNITYSEAPTDTCSPSSPLTSNQLFNCSDNCTQSTNLNAGEFNITFSDDDGHFNVQANISNFDKIFKYDACEIRIYSTGGFR